MKRDFGDLEDAVARIVKVLKDGRIVKERGRTYVVSDDGYRVAIRKDFDGERKNWVVTAFDGNRSNEVQN